MVGGVAVVFFLIFSMSNRATLTEYLSPAEVGRRCGGRSARWAKDRAKAGQFGPDVLYMGTGGWLISSVGVVGYLEQFRVRVEGMRDGR